MLNVGVAPSKHVRTEIEIFDEHNHKPLPENILTRQKIGNNLKRKAVNDINVDSPKSDKMGRKILVNIVLIKHSFTLRWVGGVMICGEMNRKMVVRVDRVTRYKYSTINTDTCILKKNKFTNRNKTTKKKDNNNKKGNQRPYECGCQQFTRSWGNNINSKSLNDNMYVIKYLFLCMAYHQQSPIYNFTSAFPGAIRSLYHGSFAKFIFPDSEGI
ncbi:hypothetical protein AGLY_014306 [Aphis glycines]|uniref:PiggyBac transposable element-derived protein domain-containing protein n=1 Tax=Aphis glycines TaxID=307491 RepID=A0A6G0T496_APHGL|nr:hypothetical protein AGLY_014306 [Aphis glycines]